MAHKGEKKAHHWRHNAYLCAWKMREGGKNVGRHRSTKEDDEDRVSCVGESVLGESLRTTRIL